MHTGANVGVMPLGHPVKDPAFTPHTSSVAANYQSE